MEHYAFLSRGQDFLIKKSKKTRGHTEFSQTTDRVQIQDMVYHHFKWQAVEYFFGKSQFSQFFQNNNFKA